MADSFARALEMMHPMREPPQPASLAPFELTLALGCAAGLVLLALALAARRRRAGLRAAALAELARTRGLPGPDRLAAQAALLRRLVRQVAGEDAVRLQGEAWLRELDRVFATGFFTQGAGVAYGDALYSATVPDVDVLEAELTGMFGRLRAPRGAPLPARGRGSEHPASQRGCGMTHGFDLATPWALLLLPVPLLVALWRRRGIGGAAGLRISDALRERMAGDATAVRPPSKTAILRWIAWVLLVVALADPRKVAATPALPATGRDILFTLDLSGSMVANDMLDHGKPITRIALLKKIGTELIRRRAGDRVGLVIFAEHALAAAPLSFDADGVARVLAQTDIGLVGRSTAMGDGLGLAVKRLSESKAPTRIIILLSDGSNNAGSMDPAGVAALAHKLGIKIYTIGFGPNDTTRPQDDPDSVDYGALQRYAKIGDGEAFRVRNAEDFEDAGAKIEKLIAGEAMAPPAVVHDELWPWPAGVAMASAFAMVVIRRRPR